MTDRPLAGLPNFRDLGGQSTRDGRRVRRGMLYRSQSLHFATEEDLQQIASWNVKLVCDLRSQLERKDHPGRWHAGAEPVRLHLEITTDARAGNEEFLQALRAAPNRDGVYRGMLINYGNMPRSFAPVLRQLFTHLNDAAHLPAIIHCHAGKDRTGFICAVILAALGVEREHLETDYLRTEQLMHRGQISCGLINMLSRLAGAPLAADAIDPLVDVHLEYLDAALDRIDADFGGMDAYLEQAGGLGPEPRARLQSLLLE